MSTEFGIEVVLVSRYDYEKDERDQTFCEIRSGQLTFGRGDYDSPTYRSWWEHDDEKCMIISKTVVANFGLGNSHHLRGREWYIRDSSDCMGSSTITTSECIEWLEQAQRKMGPAPVVSGVIGFMKGLRDGYVKFINSLPDAFKDNPDTFLVDVWWC